MKTIKTGQAGRRVDEQDNCGGRQRRVGCHHQPQLHHTATANQHHWVQTSWIMLLILGAALLSTPARAATVTSLADSGPGSLRDAIANTASGNTINFSVGGTITLTTGELLITNDLTIVGPGAHNLVIQRSLANGTPNFRIFDCAATVVISGVTISNGRDASGDGGGGIANDGDLTLANCIVSGNYATTGGGLCNFGSMIVSNCLFQSNSAAADTGDGLGGGIENDGTLWLTNSVVAGNLAASSVSSGSAFGGGIDNEFGTVYVDSCTVSGNSTRGGSSGQSEGGGVANGFGTITLNASTVSGNSAGSGAGTGGGAGGRGGGIANDFGTVDVTSSTVSGNTASGSGAPAAGGGIFNGYGSIFATCSTIASNTVPGGFLQDGGGIYNLGGEVELDSTIVAANTATVDLYNDITAAGLSLSDGYNLIGSISGSQFTPAIGDLTAVTAAVVNLGPLQNNGGPTFTHALLCGSLAIAAGDPVNSPATDQRGFPRIINGRIDSGAYEADVSGCPTLTLIKTAVPTQANPGQPVTYYYAVTNTGYVTVNNINISDDNGTPADPSDDFVVNATPFSLTPGQGLLFAIPHISEPLCISGTGGSIPAGTLTVNVLPNGDVEVFYMQSRTIGDNTYGTGAVGWPPGPGAQQLTDLANNDYATFQFTDCKTNVVLKFQADYISSAKQATFPSGTVLYPSGQGTLGVTGGNGKMLVGTASNVLSVHTTLSDTLNFVPQYQTGYLKNSPLPESAHPLWNYVSGYHVIVSHAAFGLNGFGGVTVPQVVDNPSKLGGGPAKSQLAPTNACACVVNTAVAAAYQGTNLVAAAIDNATVCFGPPPPCIVLGSCTPPYPFTSANPLTSVVFNESDILRASRVVVATGTTNCVPDHIAVFYNDEHALALGVRQVIVKTKTGTTTTNYPLTPLPASPSSTTNPAVGSTIATGDQAGVDVSGRPLFPSLFITDLTTNPNPNGGDWQYGGTAIPPTAIYGTWKGFVKTVDKTKATATVTLTADADPAKNNWNLGSNSDPAPSALANEGYGAEVRWDVAKLGLISGHTYRLYFTLHDGDQNKAGGDAGQACATITMP